MARASSGLAYRERFHAAAAYAGFNGSPDVVSSKFSNDVALLLFALYQQATVGPCKIPKSRSWTPVEQSKWTSWNGLGNMASTEAMRLFVKILEEEDPGWYSRASNSVSEPVVEGHNPKAGPITENGNAFPKTTIPPESFSDTRDKDLSESFRAVGVYDQWVTPPVSSPRPKARYEHGAAIIDDTMYVFGGNYNGRYLGDLQALDLKSWSWSRVEVKAAGEASASPVAPLSGHSLVPWEGTKLISIGGHMKNPSETVQVKVFDLPTLTCSTLETHGKPPVSRGGHSVTLVGTSIVMFGGQAANQSLLNDLHILNLETMTWDEVDTLGMPPSPRSDHAATIHAERYLLVFGGRSQTACFSDLHVLDLQTMEWSRPTQQGDIPSPRAGHAGVTVGENWFIAGGGNNKSGLSETVVLNMSTLAWSVVTTVEGHVPLASEGLSLVLCSYNGEDIIVSFGGYNGRYNNEVSVLKPSHKSTLQSKMMETPGDDLSGVQNATNATNATRDLESEYGAGEEGKIREIVMDNKSELMVNKVEETSERLLEALKAEKEELESSLNKEKLQTQQLKQQLTDSETHNSDLYKELQSVRGQLAAEQSRCFKLEVDVAELRQKLQGMESLLKELELLRRQKAASEQALNTKQRKSSGGVWGWLAPPPPPPNQRDDA